MIPLVQISLSDQLAGVEQPVRALVRGLVRYRTSGGSRGLRGTGSSELGPPPTCSCLLGLVCQQDCDSGLQSTKKVLSDRQKPMDRRKCEVGKTVLEDHLVQSPFHVFTFISRASTAS